ncbi:MAG: SUMF1/EgtB/PvdO family nonheme iron enzyme [Candidatus Eisenbacteria bacterium]|nr:SUMF1/EgtB/PvdO family nonheme iron enzyme [Candidatus Eisenbacteria bacterium]
MSRGLSWAMRGALIGLALAGLLFGCSEDTTVEVDEGGEAGPTWAYLSSTSSNALTVRWTDNATNEIAYIVQRSRSADGGFSDLATLDPNSDRYTDETVTAGERYYYRIFSVNSLGARSRPSDVVWGEAVENASPTRPASPTPADGTLDLEIPGLLTLRWSSSDADGDPILFDVFFGDASNALTKVLEASEQTSYTLDDTLALTRFYFWRVRARDPQGATSLSPLWSFGTTMERVEVPGGYLFMGDCGRFYPDDPERWCMGDHPVNGSNPVWVDRFLIDKFEVSNQLFAQFLNSMINRKLARVEDGRVYSIVYDTLYAEVYPAGDADSGIEFFPAADTDSGIFIPRPGRENHPVVEITWHGAQRFADFFGLQLPTEAQWEKAARGTLSALGDTTFLLGEDAITIGYGYPYPWGETAEANRFNYWTSGDPFESRVAVATTPVGFFDGTTRGGFGTGSNRSPYGVFDMAGNVAEWTRDEFYPYGGGTYGGMKLIKGGGWRSGTQQCQTFWRQEVLPDSTDNMLGFRTVLVE